MVEVKIMSCLFDNVPKNKKESFLLECHEIVRDLNDDNAAKNITALLIKLLAIKFRTMKMEFPDNYISRVSVKLVDVASTARKYGIRNCVLLLDLRLATLETTRLLEVAFDKTKAAAFEIVLTINEKNEILKSLKHMPKAIRKFFIRRRRTIKIENEVYLAKYKLDLTPKEIKDNPFNYSWVIPSPEAYKITWYDC